MIEATATTGVILVTSLVFAFSSATVGVYVGMGVSVLAALTTLMSVRATRKQSEASKISAEGASIKAIAEANTIALSNLRTELIRLDELARATAVQLQETTVKLRQERQWTARLIRALTAAGIPIPPKPTSDVDTDEVPVQH